MLRCPKCNGEINSVLCPECKLELEQNPKYKNRICPRCWHMKGRREVMTEVLASNKK